MQTKIGPILMGIAYLALVVFIMLFCANQASTFDDYSKYWGLFATLVGVATGAIPSFFFKAQADKATDRADKATEKAELYAGIAPKDDVKELHKENATLFSTD